MQTVLLLLIICLQLYIIAGKDLLITVVGKYKLYFPSSENGKIRRIWQTQGRVQAIKYYKDNTEPEIHLSEARAYVDELCNDIKPYEYKYIYD